MQQRQSADDARCGRGRVFVEELVTTIDALLEVLET
jgi:hypothetical protein